MLRGLRARQGLVGVGLVLLGLGSAGLAGAAPPVTVTARRLLDVDTGQMIDRPVIRIEGGVITAIGPRAAGQNVTYDLGDVTLLPGLIDCHTHLIGGPSPVPFDGLRETTARAAIEGVANAKLTLEAGFTTVRDLGARDFADVALRDAIAAGRIRGPRMLVAVQGLSATGGHGDWNELPADITIHRYSTLADGPEEIRKAVRTNLKFGADWIKVLVTGGVTSAATDPQQADYSEEEIRAAVTAAHARGKDVAAHAHGAVGILRAARAGVRSIEHASYLTDEAIAEIKRQGIFLVPNPYTNFYILDRGQSAGFMDYEIEKSRQVYYKKMESLRRAVAAGIPIAYGTDSGVQPHGNNGKQLSLYVQAGMTPLAAIQSATVVAARLLRQEHRLGRVKVGYLADLVAVVGDPLHGISVIESPMYVFKEGELVFSRPSRASDTRALMPLRLADPPKAGAK
jgi:imidazolonepropionase-like amidohydrolase